MTALTLMKFFPASVSASKLYIVKSTVNVAMYA